MGYIATDHGADYAYAMRLVESGYAGDCARVRRDSDHAEMDAGFVGDDFDKATLATWLGGANGYCTKWYDQEAAADMAQATADRQPLYVASSGPSGRPTFRFDGIDDFMTTPTVNHLSPAETWVFVSLLTDLTADTYRSMMGAHAGPGGIYSIHKNAQSQPYNQPEWFANGFSDGVNALRNRADAQGSFFSFDSNMHAHAFARSVANNEIFHRVDGTVTKTTTHTDGNFTANIFCLGARGGGSSQWWEGDISEAIHYSSRLVDNDLDDIDTDQAGYYLVVEGSGDSTLPALTASGSGAEGPVGSGAATLPALQAAGTGAEGPVGAGAVALPALQASGAGAEGPVGSGAITLPAFTGSGVGLVLKQSRFAVRFHAKARPMLWAEHGEIVEYTDADGTKALPVIWKRANDETPTSDGVGVTTYTGLVMAVVKLTDMPSIPGPEAEIIRNGETWKIRNVERQDAWTWIFHMGRPNADLHMPGRRGLG